MPKFIPTKSPLITQNPLIKMINLILFTIAMFFPIHLQLLLLCIGLPFLYILLSNVPIMEYIKAVWNLRYIIIIIFIILLKCDIYYINAIIYLMKGLSYYLYLVIIVTTSSPSALAYGLSRVINVINIFGKNANKLENRLIIFLKTKIVKDNYITNLKENKSMKGDDQIYLGTFHKKMLSLENWSQRRKKEKEIKELLKQDLDLRSYHKTINKRKKINLKPNFWDLFFLACHILIIVVYVLKVRS